ncbi:hypothetical protein BW723_03840 [Polaribacter reichenbachii]|uniref:Uncharacterized protein n=1 Tax=Polaribacter reichenbachii TaxID=996801 RepID=A0A1B8TVB7_9FLAO|nr:hypothetical protein [Polaribacter reichenbachii]APZ45481.1 hypothetical protein BW723_03840 [Polaribacter reichenbachii]AUC19342.1 hypothetical protein BTO17_11845 [Polaribacter reichenbachii]OBY63504.1 hypothetical protein LPB301_11865 [Polaribacter reichenbachii]
MKKLKIRKQHKTLFYVVLLFFLLACSNSNEEQGCTEVCESGFALNEETCSCEPIPCTLTCADDEVLNEEDCECEQFIPNVIEVDATDVSLTEDWKMKTAITGFTGDGYIVWEGASQTWKGTIGEVGKLTYKVDIPKAGTYLFQWRSYIAKKADTDPWAEHNDSWLKLLDADEFFAIRGTSKIYPKGSGKTPNPAGENGNGFFKVYMNTVDEWSRSTNTSDNNAHQIYATFNEAKEYTVIIAARSNYHAIDSFKLIEQNEQ